MNRNELTAEELTAELRSLREAPSTQFASMLDARAAAGFPSRQRAAEFARLPERIAERLRATGLRRSLLPALAGATTVIVVATAVVVSTGRDDAGDPSTQLDSPQSLGGEPGAAGGAPPAGTAQAPEMLRERKSGVLPPAADLNMTDSAPSLPPSPPGAAPGVRNRQVERSAELTLGADPQQVQDVAADAIGVVDRHRGIVLSSSVRDGGEGQAGASFDLLIPSDRLSGALADLSQVAEVRSRSENTLDITAPFVSARERLRDSRAEAEGLLRQLAEADTETERASVKAQLRVVRGRIAAFRSQVNRLERRANFSRVSLQIVSGERGEVPGAGGGSWTIGDALRDAGRILAVAAGIVLLAAAALLPLALLGGAAWAGRRIYLRRVREQTLSA
jgi:hypothetical protein